MSRIPLFRRRLSVLLGVVCLFTPLSAHGQLIPEDLAEFPEVVELEFRGVRAADADELREAIATEETECKSLLVQPICWFSTAPLWVDKAYLEPLELRRDLLRIKIFYFRRGFREANADVAVTRLARDEVRVTFFVEEGPPTIVRQVRVRRPPDILSDDQISRLVVLEAEDPLNLLELDSTVARIEAALWENGYSDAIVDTNLVVYADQRLADVTIDVDPRWRATVDRIVILGNERVADRTILNSLTLSEGDIYRRSDVVRSQRNLYESQLFQYAAIIVPPQGDTTKLIEVRVREAPLQEARIAAGFNTRDFIQLEGRYVNYNWFGSARRLEVRTGLGNLFADQLSGFGFGGIELFDDIEGEIEEDADVYLRPNWQASIDVRQPWFLSAENSFGVGVFAHRRSYPNVFVDRGYGAQGSFTREIADEATLSANYRFEVTQLFASDVYFCVTFGFCDRETLAAIDRNQRLSPLSLIALVDRTDDPLARTDGWSLQGSLEHASQWTASDFRYNRAYAEGAVYWPIWEGTLASRVRIGWAKPRPGPFLSGGEEAVLHPRKRFYAGGAQSVRGFGENQLGPRVLTIAPEQLEAIPGCDPSTLEVRACPINAVNDTTGDPIIPDRAFQPRPLGGRSLLEGSIEYRHRFGETLIGAVFIDAAVVGQGEVIEALDDATGAITPGVGIRYMTPVGPIRVDVGYNPGVRERLPVITQVTVDGERRLVTLERQRVYAPGSDLVGLRRFLSRLTLHLSIGEAF